MNVKGKLIRDPRITVTQGRFSAERLYTLTEIKALAREWSSEPTDSDAVSRVEEDLSIGLTLSIFLAWLKKREREVEE